MHLERESVAEDETLLDPGTDGLFLDDPTGAVAEWANIIILIMSFVLVPLVLGLGITAKIMAS